MRLRSGSQERLIPAGASGQAGVHGLYNDLFRFDVSGSGSNPLLAYGVPVVDPDTIGGWAVEGVILDGAREVYLAGATDGPQLRVTERAVLSFRCRIKGHGPLRVFAHNLTRGVDVMADLGEMTTSAWRTIHISLARFTNLAGTSHGVITAGDELRNLIIASDPPQTLTMLRIDQVVVSALTSSQP